MLNLVKRLCEEGRVDEVIALLDSLPIEQHRFVWKSMSAPFWGWTPHNIEAVMEYRQRVGGRVPESYKKYQKIHFYWTTVMYETSEEA